MLDERIAELRQARELLVEFEGLATHESKELEMLLSPRREKVRVLRTAEAEPVSLAVHAEEQKAAHARLSSNDDDAKKPSEEIRQPSERQPQSVPKTRPSGPLGGVIPAGPVVVPRKDRQTTVTSEPVEANEQEVSRSESSLKELAREVAARMGINRTESQGIRLN